MGFVSDIFNPDLALRGLVLVCLVAWAARACRQQPKWFQGVLSGGLLLAVLLPLAGLLPQWQIGLTETHFAGPFTGGITAWTLLAGIWVLGAVLFFSRIGFGLHRLRQMKRAAVVCGDAGLLQILMQVTNRLRMRRLPTVYLSSQIELPMAVGWLGRGAVFLPAAASEWTEERMRFVLQHEAAHLQRRDVLWNLLGHFACALHWWNPLIWRLHRASVLAREKGCDTMAVSAGIPAVSYAKSLMSFAIHGAEPQMIGAGMAGSDLHERIRSLLASQAPAKKAPSVLTLCGLLLCGLACITSLTASLHPPKIQQSTVSRYENAALRLQANPFPADEAYFSAD